MYAYLITEYIGYCNVPNIYEKFYKKYILYFSNNVLKAQSPRQRSAGVTVIDSRHNFYRIL